MAKNGGIKSSVPEDFSELQGRIFDLYRDGAHGDALDLVLESRSAFPERLGRLSFWAACLRSRLGQPDEAMDALRRAVQEGFWHAEMFGTDPDLEPLRAREDFHAVLVECERQREAAQATARPKLLVEVSPDYDPNEEYPLLLALHGRGGSAEDSVHHWIGALSLGLIVALPQSSLVMGAESFSWDDTERARTEIRVHYDTLLREYPVDARNVILAGYSQGGTLALSLALEGETIPARSFIVVAPSPLPQGEGLEADIERAARRGMRGLILTGERDPARKSTEGLHLMLRERGLRCDLWVEPGRGHEFPPNFDSKLTTAIRLALRDVI